MTTKVQKSEAAAVDPELSGVVTRKPKPKRRTAKRKAPPRQRLVRKALRLIEQRLDSEEINSTLGDLIRLLELAEHEKNEGTTVLAGWVGEDYRE